MVIHNFRTEDEMGYLLLVMVEKEVRVLPKAEN